MTEIPADNFSACFAFTLGAEGAYTDDAADPGNWTSGVVNSGTLRGTKFGISAAAYPTLDIASLTQETAEEIYRHNYWIPLQGDSLPLKLAMVGFDAAVNAGVHMSVVWLQEAAGQQADGDLGADTLAALNAGEALALAREALVRRLDYYSHLSTWGDFSLGWTRRIIALAGEIGA